MDGDGFLERKVREVWSGFLEPPVFPCVPCLLGHVVLSDCFICWVHLLGKVSGVSKESV